MSESVGDDPAAFFRELYPRLYRFVAASVRRAADAEDVVQETLLQAWRDRERFRGHASLATWVLSIARHRLIDLERRKGPAVLARAIERFDAELVPPDVLESEEMGREVHRALAELPDELEALLIQRYFRGMTVREIAEEAGDSEKAVESRLQRAREAFRNTLQKGSDHGPA